MRDDLIQHFAVGGLITGLWILLLAPNGWPVVPAVGIGLILCGLAAIGREALQARTNTGTPDPADAAATYAGGIAIACAALPALGA